MRNHSLPLIATPPPPPHFELLYATVSANSGLATQHRHRRAEYCDDDASPNTGLGTTATMVADPAGKFLFVYDTEGEAIDVFAINSTTSA